MFARSLRLTASEVAGLADIATAAAQAEVAGAQTANDKEALRAADR